MEYDTRNLLSLIYITPAGMPKNMRGSSIPTKTLKAVPVATTYVRASFIFLYALKMLSL
jgi:hypothetical protein